MNKTHKRALGFAGLGLVATLTIAAAALPTPAAMAVSSLSDVIQVRIAHGEPEISANEVGPREDTSSSYSFHVTYENIKNISATIVNKDDGGGVLYSGEFWNEDVDWAVGEKNFTLNLNDYAGYGNFTITVTGIGEGGVPVERILTFKYTEQAGEKDSDKDGTVEVDIDIPDERPASTEIKVYDETGTLVKTIPIENPSGVENVNLGVSDGSYDLEIINKDSNGRILSTRKKKVVVDTDGLNAYVNLPIEDKGEQIGHVDITIKDSNGNIITEVTLNNPTIGTINVDLPDYTPAGNYSTTLEYFNQSGVKIASNNIDFTKSDLNAVVPVDVTTKKDTVTQVEINIYDSEGNLVRIVRADRATGTVNVYDKNGGLLFTVPNGLKGTKLVIPMDGLAYGEYVATIAFKNEFGEIVGNIRTIKIKYTVDETIIVPDTGSFFQNLNISREDYLITGLAVFMVIGVVAFGVVVRNKRNRR